MYQAASLSCAATLFAQAKEKMNGIKRMENFDGNNLMGVVLNRPIRFQKPYRSSPKIETVLWNKGNIYGIVADQ